MTKAMGARTSIQADRCHRCGGLMVPEQVFEIRSIDWRCISCGERIDSVILAHRRGNFAGGEDGALSHGKREAALSNQR